jgi:predicted regulator of Ras-like GTPase activity (Roadblock/LC7/MglB family)
MTARPIVPDLASLARLRGVRAALLTALADALPIESRAHVDVDRDALAAFATDLYRRATQSAAVADVGAVRVVALEAAAGRLFAAARDGLLLVVLAERETNPGLLRLALRRALEGLAEG